MFGSAIQVLPSDLREYFNLSFISTIVVFIIFCCFFSLLYSEITLCNVYYFCYSKYVFFKHCRILFVRNKVLLYLLNICKKVFILNLKLLTNLVTFYLLTAPQAKVKMTLRLLLKILD